MIFILGPGSQVPARAHAPADESDATEYKMHPVNGEFGTAFCAPIDWSIM